MKGCIAVRDERLYCRNMLSRALRATLHIQSIILAGSARRASRD